MGEFARNLRRGSGEQSRPRYSVIVPTRNGGSILGACLSSILSQDHPSFEVVVSDNANDDETPGVLEGLAHDERIIALRQHNPLPVTENWTAAAAASSGEYILLIGDDDLLLPGTLQAFDGLLAISDDPECLSFDAFEYVAPDAADRTTSFYGSPYFGYDEQLTKDGFVSPSMRATLVREAFGFRFRFPLSTQLTLIKRTATARLPGDLFRSAFPDHYAISALLLTARTWFVTDRQLVVLGTSTKSFRHSFFHDEDDSGFRYLGVEPNFNGRLPGNDVLNGQCDWLAQTRRDFAAQLAGVEIDRGAYVARQVRHWLRQYQLGAIPLRLVLSRLRRLSAGDVTAVLRTHGRPTGLRDVVRATAGLRQRRMAYVDRELTALPEVADVAEFGAWLHARRLTPAHWVEASVAGSR